MHLLISIGSTNILRQNAGLTRQKNLPGSIYSRYCCLVLLALRHQQQQVRPRQCKSRRREANENIETELEVYFERKNNSNQKNPCDMLLLAR